MTPAAPPVTPVSDSLIPLAIALVRACLAFASGLFSSDVPPILGPDTTVISEPLAADGLPDYAAYARSLLGSGTPPEENAAVPLLAACWPAGIHKDDLPVICREIGASDKPPRFATIGAMRYFYAEMREALETLVKERLGGETNGRGSEPNLLDDFMDSPWRGDEVPPVRDWLDERAAAFDMILEASERPRFYLPQEALLKSNRTNALISAYGELSAVGHAGRALSLRAMRHLGEGRLHDAWRDIFAAHKLARLAVGPHQRGSLVSQLIAGAVSSLACDATLRLLDTQRLRPEEIAAIRRDLASLPSLVNRRDRWELERLTVVASTVDFATMPRATRAEKIQNGFWLGVDDPGLSLVFWSGIDWNVALRSVNRFSSAIAHASCQPRWADRRASLEALDNHVKTAVVRMDPKRATRRFFGLLFDPEFQEKPQPLQDAAESVQNKLQSLVRASAAVAADRTTRSEIAGRILTALVFSVIVETDTSLTRAETRIALVRVAAALAAWRASEGRGRYPERLDKLVPNLLPELPTDPFSGKSFVYERRGDGYLLYGLGSNGIDDGGTGYHTAIVRGEWSDDASLVGKNEGTDDVIRMPIPPSADLERFRKAGQAGSAGREGHTTSQPAR